MKKLFIPFLAAVIFLTGCATNKSIEAGSDTYAAFGCFQITFQNYEMDPKINGTYKSNITVHLKDNSTNKKSTVKTDNEGFFYIDGLKKFTSYTIESFGVHPYPANPDAEWTWGWSRDFSISYEDIMNLGDTVAIWDAGGKNPSSQSIEYNCAASIYERKYNAKYEKPVFNSAKDFSKVEKYKNDKPDPKISALVNEKDIKKLQKKNPEKYVNQVSEKILEWAEDDFDKAKLAHDVVALILEYDADHFWKGKIPSQDYKSVLKTGKSVCAGYASVYKAFCDKLHLPCIVVGGFAKGVGFDPKATSFETNHDWNIVQINKEWYFIDCTWDSGYMDGKKNVQQYITDYLFTKPEHAIYSHYPENPEYQLLEKPFTEKDIIFVPNLKPAVFIGKNPFTVEVKSFDADRGEAILLFKYKKNDKLTVSVKSSSIHNANQCREQTITEDSSTVHLKFPEKGIYTLSVTFYQSDKCLNWDFTDYITFNYQQ